MWFLTGLGPFKNYLYWTGKTNNEWCRYCELAVESSQHLLFSCNGIATELKFSANGEIDIDINELEKKCKRLVQKLYRDHGRIN